MAQMDLQIYDQFGKSYFQTLQAVAAVVGVSKMERWVILVVLVAAVVQIRVVEQLLAVLVVLAVVVAEQPVLVAMLLVVLVEMGALVVEVVGQSATNRALLVGLVV